MDNEKRLDEIERFLREASPYIVTWKSSDTVYLAVPEEGCPEVVLEPKQEDAKLRWWEKWIK